MVSLNVFLFTVFRQSDHSGEDRSGIDLQNRTGFPVTHLIKNKSSEHQLIIIGILTNRYSLSTRIERTIKICHVVLKPFALDKRIFMR